MNKYNQQPIEIGRLQRHAMDYFYSHSPTLPVPEEGSRQGACVGGGPASLARAAGLRRNGVAVTTCDRHTLPGALNTYGIAQHTRAPAAGAPKATLVRSTART